MELQGYMVNFMRNCLSSKAAEPFYISTSICESSNFLISSTLVFPFFLFHFLNNSMPVGVKWYLTVVLDSISLMAHDIVS